MSKPINRTKQKQRYQILSVLLYLSFCFFGLHLGKGDLENEMLLVAALNHMTQHPLDILPIDWETMGKVMFFGILIPLLMHSEYLKHRDLRPSEENGSSRWNEDISAYNKKYAEMVLKWPRLLAPIMDFLDRTIRKVPLLGAIYRFIYNLLAKRFGALDKRPGSKNMIFSKEIYLSMNGRKTRRNCNILCIGGSGTGKSRFLVKPNLLQSNCSYVITDPSGELLETMGKYLENQGYEVRVFNLVQMDHSFCYNPFNYIRDDNGVLIMITALIKNTTPKGSSSNDPFWEKAETALLQALCFFLQSECNPEDRNFTNVMKLLRCAEVREGQEDYDSTLDIMFKDLKARNPEHIAVRQYAVFKQAAGKTAQSILVSCSVRLTVFNMQSISTLTGTDNIDLASVGDRPVALFCITPTADTTFNFLVAMMYTQLFETLYFHAETQCKGKRLTHHVRFLLDEFANIGTIPDFPQKLSTMRKYEISCTIIIQALSQLKAMYKDDWEVLVGNCDSRLFLGGADETTLKYISNSLGKETIRAISNSRSYSRQGSYSQNFNKTGRELMTEQELSVMDNNNCVLFIRGEYPFFCTKYPLEKHPNYKLSGDADDSLLYDVTKEIQTGHARSTPRKPDPYARIYEECQQADIRESERRHRQATRPMDQRSARGRTLGASESLQETARRFTRDKRLAEDPTRPIPDATLVAAVQEIYDTPTPEGGSELIEGILPNYIDYQEPEENEPSSLNGSEGQLDINTNSQSQQTPTQTEPEFDLSAEDCADFAAFNPEALEETYTPTQNISSDGAITIGPSEDPAGKDSFDPFYPGFDEGPFDPFESTSEDIALQEEPSEYLPGLDEEDPAKS